MSESNFEIAFSDLAHASLAEKAPGLMEYLVGFQLLDKNDEDTHAVAVFGFKLGNQWFYAPVFFLNGALKGMDLLYVKSQDLFVPLQDNWVNYLISKQPRNIGQTEQVPEKDLDLMQPDFRVFSEAPGTSGTKWASSIPVRSIKDWAKPFLPAYKGLVSGFQKKAAELSERMDLRAVLRRAPELTPTLVATMKSNVKFAEAVLSFYDLKELLPDPKVVKRALLNLSPKVQRPVSKNIKLPTATPAQGRELHNDLSDIPKVASVLAQVAGTEKQAEHVGDNHKWGYSEHYNTTEEVLKSLSWRGQEKKAASDDEYIKDDGEGPNVEVLTQEDIPQVLAERGGSATLTEAEKEQLQKGEMVIRDHRKDTSKVYEAEFDRHITNPTESGVYDVLTSVGKFERCLVINNPKTVGDGRTSAIATLVSLEGTKRWGNFRNIDILVHQAEQAVKSFEDRFQEAFGKAKELSAMKSGWLYVLIGPNGNGTIPFKYLTQIDRNDGTTVYAVKPKTYVQRCKNNVRSTLSTSQGFRMAEGIELEDFDSDLDSPAVVPDDNDDKKKKPYDSWDLRTHRQLIQSDRGQYTQLKSVGGVTFVPNEGWKVYEIGADPNNQLTAAKEQALAFEPGALLDAETYVFKLGAQGLIVQKDGPEYVIRHDKGQMRLTKQAMIKHLIIGWQMRGSDAKILVKRAEEKKIVQCFVKLAQGLDAPPGGPAFPSYVSSYNDQLGVPIQEQQTDFVDVPGMQPNQDNRSVYKLMEDPEVQNALASAEKGQKEIFDTSIMGGLVKTVDVDALVDSFLPDMIKGMDRVGRVLFLFYWHNESFRDRYGRQDLVELEDSLRNVFKATGDMVLFLKQKTIDAEPMTDAIDIDLEAAAG